MAIHLDKLGAILLGVAILIVVILIGAGPFNTVREYIINSDIGNIVGLQNEGAQRQASTLFNDMTLGLDICSKSAKTECRCFDGKIVFPKDYSLLLNNNNKNEMNIKVRTNTNQELKDYTLSGATACYVLLGRLSSNIDIEDPRPLKIKFGSKNIFEYKRKSHDLDVALIFYKEKQGGICVVEKNVAKTLLAKSIC